MSTGSEEEFGAQNLEFQTFSNTSNHRTSQGALSPPIGGAFAPSSTTSFNIDIPSPTTTSQTPHSFWHVQYYAQWFNVDTSDVVARVMLSAVPVSDVFFDKIQPNPDLYGPVWISSTVIFMLAATANFANWLNYTVRMNLSSSAWSVDVSKMTFGASIVYSYAFVVPLFVYLALRYAGVRLALVDTICLYGYSLFVYIPASVLCVPPSAIMQWISVALACVASTLFIGRSLRRVVAANSSAVANEPMLKTTIGVACVLSIGLAVLMKLFLFENADFNVNGAKSTIATAKPALADVTTLTTMHHPLVTMTLNNVESLTVAAAHMGKSSETKGDGNTSDDDTMPSLADMTPAGALTTITTTTTATSTTGATSATTTAAPTQR